MKENERLKDNTTQENEKSMIIDVGVDTDIGI